MWDARGWCQRRTSSGRLRRDSKIASSPVLARVCTGEVNRDARLGTVAIKILPQGLVADRLESLESHPDTPVIAAVRRFHLEAPWLRYLGNAFRILAVASRRHRWLRTRHRTRRPLSHRGEASATCSAGSRPSPPAPSTTSWVAESRDRLSRGNETRGSSDACPGTACVFSQSTGVKDPELTRVAVFESDSRRVRHHPSSKIVPDGQPPLLSPIRYLLFRKLFTDADSRASATSSWASAACE